MIAVQDLTKYYGPAPAISRLSFEVQQGEIVGFLGPNGAGKTTTLKILAGFLPPTSGQARINGHDCVTESLAVRRSLGYLPETAPLYTELTVLQFLRFAARAKGVEAGNERAEVDRVAEACGLMEVQHTLISSLSKGFRQRVGLAQALLNSPPLLILDEPTIGLDPAQIVEIRQLIKELSGDHTVVLSSHILPEVSQLCQRVIIINKGQIVASDTPENLSRQLGQGSRLKLAVRGPAPEIMAALAGPPRRQGSAQPGRGALPGGIRRRPRTAPGHRPPGGGQGVGSAGIAGPGIHPGRGLSQPGHRGGGITPCPGFPPCCARN
jgi:ABC-2 type transport system ATP-binding protein